MTFAEKLKQHRKRLGLTQAGLARFLDVKKTTVEKWEYGVQEPMLIAQEGALARLVNAKPL